MRKKQKRSLQKRKNSPRGGMIVRQAIQFSGPLPHPAILL